MNDIKSAVRKNPTQSKPVKNKNDTALTKIENQLKPWMEHLRF